MMQAISKQLVNNSAGQPRDSHPLIKSVTTGLHALATTSSSRLSDNAPIVHDSTTRPMNQRTNNSSSIDEHHYGNNINNERMFQPNNDVTDVTDVTDAHTSTADGIDSGPYLLSSGAKKKQRRKRRRINSGNDSPVEFHSAASYGDKTMPQS